MIFSSELIKGTLKTIVLKLLADNKKMYGYEITQYVKELTGERIQLTEGALPHAACAGTGGPCNHRAGVYGQTRAQVLYAEPIRQETFARTRVGAGRVHGDDEGIIEHSAKKRLIMYRVTDEQVDYILGDLVAKGIDTEDLQLNLLDHICCIMERELKEPGDFERFYQSVIPRFYRRELREIEEETTNLLTFKNYYAMRKTLIVSGVFAVFTFIFGSLFKFMYWPGASVLLALGIATFSLLFLPLLFVLKAREARSGADKAVVGIAVLTGTLFSLAILFIVQHWPASNVLLFTSIGIATFVLLPAYFFNGIRRPEARLNTIVMSIILVGIIGLQFTLLRLRPSASQAAIYTDTYVQAEAMLGKLLAANPPAGAQAEIHALAEKIKSMALERAVGGPAVPADYEARHINLRDGDLGPEFTDDGTGVQLLRKLQASVNAYAAAANNGDIAVMVKRSVLHADPADAGKLYSRLALISSINQLQTYLALNPQAKIAAR